MAMIGESGPEAVIPLSQMKQPSSVAGGSSAGGTLQFQQVTIARLDIQALYLNGRDMTQTITGSASQSATGPLSGLQRAMQTNPYAANAGGAAGGGGSGGGGIFGGIGNFISSVGGALHNLTGLGGGGGGGGSGNGGTGNVSNAGVGTGGNLLSQSEYAALWASESPGANPTAANPTTVLGISDPTGVHAGPGINGTNVFKSAAPPGYTPPMQMFTSSQQAETAFDNLIRQHPDAMAYLAQHPGDFTGFLKTIAPWYEGQGPAAATQWVSNVSGIYTPGTVPPGISQGNTDASGSQTPAPQGTGAQASPEGRAGGRLTVGFEPLDLTIRDQQGAPLIQTKVPPKRQQPLPSGWLM